MKFREFRLTTHAGEHQGPVLVNRDFVTTATPCRAGTIITFGDNDNYVLVVEAYEEVMAWLLSGAVEKDAA